MATRNNRIPGNNLGSYLVDKKSPEGRSNPREPSSEGFVRGGEQQGREVRPQSGITTFRRVNPDNPHVANQFTNFVFDLSGQRSVVPKNVACGGLARDEANPTVPMNFDGKPAHALPNITVGAGTDDKGVPL